jgi:hypothetical protein
MNDTHYVPESCTAKQREEVKVELTEEDIDKIQVLALDNDCSVGEVISKAIENETQRTS